MPRMIVTVRGGFRYAARFCAEGEYFEATNRDAKLLAAIGKARLAPQLRSSNPDHLALAPAISAAPARTLTPSPTPEPAPTSEPAPPPEPVPEVVVAAPVVDEEETPSKLSPAARPGMNRYNRRDLKARD